MSGVRGVDFSLQKVCCLWSVGRAVSKNAMEVCEELPGTEMQLSCALLLTAQEIPFAKRW